MSRDRITLKNIAFFGYHGVSPAEKELGQKFYIDVDLYLDLKKTGESDSLDSAVDYELVHHSVKQALSRKKYNLLEGIGEAVAKEILSSFPVKEVAVRVRKPHLPLEGILDYAEIEIRREK